MDKDFYEKEFVQELLRRNATLEQVVRDGFNGVYDRIDKMDTKFDLKIANHEKSNADDFKDVRGKQSFADGRAAGIAGFLSIGVTVVLWLITRLVDVNKP